MSGVTVFSCQIQRLKRGYLVTPTRFPVVPVHSTRPPDEMYACSTFKEVVEILGEFAWTSEVDEDRGPTG